MTPEDPTSPDFWNRRFIQGRTPWDAGGVPRELSAYLDTHAGAGSRVLIPGCGSGYEIAAFDKGGYRVVAIDFSEAAVHRAQLHLQSRACSVVHGNFFDHDFGGEPFAVIYERAFLCSLPLALRASWGSRIGQLLGAGGRLLGYFYCGEEGQGGAPPDAGPPFVVSRRQVQELLGTQFELVEDTRVAQSLSVFEDGERWQVWERRPRPS